MYEHVTDTVEEASKEVPITMTETSKVGFGAIADVNENFPELMTDRDITASYSRYSLMNLVKTENTNQFKLVKDPNSKKFKDLLINETICVTLYEKLLTLVGSNEKVFIEMRTLQNDNQL